MGSGVGGPRGPHGRGKLVWKTARRGEDGDRADNRWVLFHCVVVLVRVRRREKGGERVARWKVVVEDIMIRAWGAMVLEERGRETLVRPEAYSSFVFPFSRAMCASPGMGVPVDRSSAHKSRGGGWKRCSGADDGTKDSRSLSRDAIQGAMVAMFVAVGIEYGKRNVVRNHPGRGAKLGDVIHPPTFTDSGLRVVGHSMMQWRAPASQCRETRRSTSHTRS